MMGVAEFIRRMAKDTPSGYPPNNLMKTVMTPQPTPKMSIPLLVTGLVSCTKILIHYLKSSNNREMRNYYISN